MFAAVDIGGTKTLVAVFDTKGKILEQIKFPTPQNYEDFKIELAKVVDNLSTKDFKASGVACTGKIDHKNGHLLVSGNLGWRDVPLQHDIERICKAPVHIQNDAKAATLAEAISAGDSFKKVVYITVSTGIGIGFANEGKLDEALNSAEAGWMSLEHKGEMLPWEKFASGKAIVAKYGKRASELDDPQAWLEISRNLAKGLITIIAVLQPDLIVFGGGVGSHLNKFKKPLLAELKKYENPLVRIPPIKESKHPEEAVIYGCYYLARQYHEKLTT